MLVNCFLDAKNKLRCSKCRHEVKIHKPSKTGYSIANGFCNAKLCNCDVPFQMMGVVEND